MRQIACEPLPIKTLHAEPKEYTAPVKRWCTGLRLPGLNRVD